SAYRPALETAWAFPRPCVFPDRPPEEWQRFGSCLERFRPDAARRGLANFRVYLKRGHGARSTGHEGERHGGAILRDFFFCDIVLNVYIRTDNLRYRKESLMPDDVDTLETKRSKLLEEFLSLGDLRPGSLTAVMRRCGKPSCHCAKRNDPGHDPQFRLTRRVAGKTVTETFPNPTALRKAQQEVTEFHRFQKLSQDLVALNEKICRLRPVEQQRGGWTEQEKKNAAAIHEEVAREVNRFLGLVFAQRHKDGRTDLEAVESALRAALHQAGAATLAELLKFEAPAAEQRQLPCPCGHHAQYQELRSKPVVTIVGPASVSRPYFLCAQCGVGQFPVDVELDIENTEFSPGVRRMHALVGQEAPFDHGRQQMKVLAGLEVTTKSVERTAEAIGADIAQREQAEIKKALQLDLPVVADEPIPILYVQMDGTGVPVVKKE